MMHNYFRSVQGTYFCGAMLLAHARSASEDSWQIINEFEVLRLTRNLFADYPKMLDIIGEFGCEPKLSIFRMKPWYNYSWHVDTPRKCSFNMLLGGYDSVCMFGKMQAFRHYDEISILPYRPNTLWLLNVHQWHSIVNYNETRYVLSLGLPESWDFDGVCDKLDQLGL